MCHITLEAATNPEAPESRDWRGDAKFHQLSNETNVFDLALNERLIFLTKSTGKFPMNAFQNGWGQILHEDIKVCCGERQERTSKTHLPDSAERRQ